ncbi:hypothetical protein [Brevundimonas diminuta]|uniref:hypothetical protein n=1 Tax=Brevundimonas diminuta TaxID=293 RepID=UPI0025A52E66|nr:hypothetical protein [Brevundimonas diminuta]MDM8352903.1 hypothetical protein [Brevundimonas diminuta]
MLDGIGIDLPGDNDIRPLGWLAKLVGGQDYQNYTQALATYESSLMPIMSGAAVTASEAQRMIRADFPQLGDSEETIRRKAGNRLRRLNAIYEGLGKEQPFSEEMIANPSLVAQAEEEVVNAISGAMPVVAQPGDDDPEPVDISGMSAEDLLKLQPGQRIRFPDGRVETLSGAPRVGADGEQVAPGVYAAPQTPEQAVEERRDMNGIARRVDGAVRGAADMMTFGLADEIAAVGDTLIGRGSYQQNIARQRGQDQADEQDIPLSRGVGQLGGAIAAPGAVAAGKFVANAPRLGYTMTRGSAVGAGYGAAYGAGSAEGGFGERAEGAGRGLMTGAVVGAVAPPLAQGVGAVAGAVARPFRPMVEGAGDLIARLRGNPVSPQEQAARHLGRGLSLDDVEAQVAQFRAQGVEPTFADAGGSNVQSRVRVAATRQTPGRERAEQFAAGRRQDVQEYTAGLGERVSPIQATPTELDEGLAAYQREASRSAFDAVRGERISLDPDSVMALRGEQGRSAIRDAARAFGSSVDPDERNIAAELNRLADAVIDEPNVQITVGAADLMSRYLQKAGGTDMNLRRVFGGAGRAIRQNARNQVGGYDEALKGYAQRAALSDAASAGEAFVGNRGHARDYVNAVQAMSEPQRAIAAAAGRAGVERAAETPAGAARFLDAAANARGQRQRAAALLGEEGAASLREGAVIGRRLMTTAQNVNPRAGSNTFLNASDGEAPSGLGNLARGRPFSAAIDFIRSTGISDEMAENVVEMALDPSQTDELIAILRTRFPEREAFRIVERLTPLLGMQAGGATAPQQPRLMTAGTAY